MVQVRNDPPGTVHGSAARVGDRGVLIRGPSGSGKSSLVLALLLADRDANRLIADDRVILGVEGGRLLASPPPALAGLIEVRGLGIRRQAHVPQAEISLVVDLSPAAECPRLPRPEAATIEIEGVRLDRLQLPIGLADGWMRVVAALTFPAALV